LPRFYVLSNSLVSQSLASAGLVSNSLASASLLAARGWSQILQIETGQDKTSRMKGDFQVRFCGRLEVKFLRSTRRIIRGLNVKKKLGSTSFLCVEYKKLKTHPKSFSHKYHGRTSL